MEFTKDDTLEDMMRFPHNLEEMRKNLDMVKRLSRDGEFITIKKE